MHEYLWNLLLWGLCILLFLICLHWVQSVIIAKHTHTLRKSQTHTHGLKQTHCSHKYCSVNTWTLPCHKDDQWRKMVFLTVCLFLRNMSSSYRNKPHWSVVINCTGWSAVLAFLASRHFRNLTLKLGNSDFPVQMERAVKAALWVSDFYWNAVNSDVTSIPAQTYNFRGRWNAAYILLPLPSSSRNSAISFRLEKLCYLTEKTLCYEFGQTCAIMQSNDNWQMCKHSPWCCWEGLGGGSGGGGGLWCTLVVMLTHRHCLLLQVWPGGHVLLAIGHLQQRETDRTRITALQLYASTQQWSYSSHPCLSRLL